MKQRLDERLSNVRFDEQMSGQVMERIAGEQGESYGSERMGDRGGSLRNIKGTKRRFQIIIAASLCIVLLTGVCFAAELPQRLMSKMGILLEPIQQTCVFDGIELNVLGAARDEDSAEVYFTLRDLEGDRISEDTSVYDFNLSKFGVVGCIKDGYDPKTRTASFYLEGDGGADLEGKKLELSVTLLVNGASDMKLFGSEISPEELLDKQQQSSEKGKLIAADSAENAVDFWNCQNQEGVDHREAAGDMSGMQLLPEGNMNVMIPGLDWASVSNVAYQDGWLHLQVKYDLEKKGENHGYFCLLNADGTEADNAVLNKPYVEPQRELEEFIIRVEEPEKLREMKLGGRFTEIKQEIKGEWKSVFRLEKAEVKTIPYSLTDERGAIDRVSLSVMGVTLYGTPLAEENPASERQVAVRLKDGKLLEAEGARSVVNENTAYCKYRLSGIMDISEITDIIVDGHEISVSNAKIQR